jgi:hypothetical protein
MSKGDLLVERGARRLQELADRAASRGDGIGERLSVELRNDAAFLRKLKPSLVKARAKGTAPTNQQPAEAPAAPTMPPPVSQPRPKKSKPKAKKRSGRRGPPPLAIIGAAFVAGIVVAKVVDWRGHAHPRD